MAVKLQTGKDSGPVSLHALYRGMESAVALIDKYGDAYWPVFARLEAEINERESRAKRLSKFRHVHESLEETAP